ncbi:MAG: glycosyltransferase family 4 protein [Patescibacteria group bacterium]|nr:glycosyltransferase family 4 protein [Patescibacteria group bacterium]
MKAFLLITLDYPPRLGGVANYLARFAELFRPDRLIVLAPEEGDTHAVDVISPVPIYRRKLVWRWFRPGWLPAFIWTDWLCRKEPPAGLIVSHLLPIGEIAYLMKKRRGLPYVVFVHGYDLALAAHAGGRKRLLAKRILGKADLVVANSGYTSKLAEALGAAPERLMIAKPSPNIPPYHVVEPALMAATRARFAGPEDFLLLSVGRLVKRKGFDTCLQAVADLNCGRHSVRYVIVGEGPDRERLTRMAHDLGIADLVTFLGAVPQEDLPALFASCDVFVMVPRSVGPDVEGFGIVYLEAAVFGKPVIGSRSGGVPEAVLDGETGILVDPLKPAELAAKICRLRYDREYAAKLGENGRRRVVDEFGWKRQLRPVLARLDELAKQ